MSEKPKEAGAGNDLPVVPVVPEIRTQRLVVVDEHGAERAVIRVKQGVVELCMNSRAAGRDCEVLMFAGEQEPGLFTAGVEFSANGEAVGGSSVVVQGSGLEFERWP